MRTPSAILAFLGVTFSAAATAAQGASPMTSRPAGQGTVKGSILLTVPGEISDPAAQKVFDSLRAKKYDAKIRRFVHHESGIADRVEFVGDTYDVPFEPGIEQRFVFSAPAGTYSMTRIASTDLIEGNRLCMKSPATFRIEAEKDTYVGQMTIAVTFLPYDAVEMPRFVRKTMKSLPGSKGVFGATISVVDRNEESGVDVQLMESREKQPLNSCEKAPPSQPPK